MSAPSTINAKAVSNRHREEYGRTNRTSTSLVVQRGYKLPKPGGPNVSFPRCQGCQESTIILTCCAATCTRYFCSHNVHKVFEHGTYPIPKTLKSLPFPLQQPIAPPISHSHSPPLRFSHHHDLPPYPLRRTDPPRQRRLPPPPLPKKQHRPRRACVSPPPPFRPTTPCAPY